MKKKFLFISNVSNKVTNFSIPSILAAQYLNYEFHFAANLTNFHDDPSEYGIILHHIELDRNPFNFKNIRAYFQMLKLIEREKFDAIHCNTPIGGILGRLCGKRAKVPRIIYTVHGFHFYKGAPLIHRTLFKWAEFWMAKYTDTIITINKEDFESAKEMELKNSGRVYYVPGVGVNTTKVKKTESKRDNLIKEVNASDDSILIISTGELNKNKNNKVIVEALAKLQNKKIHYILCGVGDKKKEIHRLAVNKNIESNVHFFGYRNDIAELLKSSDIFVMPSYREGLSRSVMEAMSAGLPCVVSDIRGNSDLIDEGSGGYRCHPSDVKKFSEVIDRLAIDIKLRADMGQYNVEKVKEFDIENIKSKMKKIYMRELL